MAANRKRRALVVATTVALVWGHAGTAAADGVDEKVTIGIATGVMGLGAMGVGLGLCTRWSTNHRRAERLHHGHADRRLRLHAGSVTLARHGDQGAGALGTRTRGPTAMACVLHCSTHIVRTTKKAAGAAPARVCGEPSWFDSRAYDHVRERFFGAAPVT